MDSKIILLLLSGFFSALIINYFADILPLTQMYLKPRIWVRSYSPQKTSHKAKQLPIRYFNNAHNTKKDNSLRKPKFGLPYCRSCNTPLNMKTYFFHKSCSECGTKPSLRRWIVLILFPLLVLFIFLLPNDRLSFIEAYILLFYFSIIFIIDFEYRIILTPINLLGYIIGGVIGSQLHGWRSTLIGGVSGFLIMLGLHYFGIIFSKTLSRKNNQSIDEVSLGFGDVILAGTIGLLLGWPGVGAGLFMSIVFGGIGSGIYLIYNLFRKTYQPFTAIPYAPFIIISTMWLLLR